MLSLLYSDGRQISHADPKLVDDLLLDTAFAEVCPDVTKRQIFLSVLTNPLTDTSEIQLRSEILHDFTAAPNLCEGLRHELDALTKLRDNAQKERSRAYTTSRSTDSDAALSNARLIAMIYAQTAQKAVYTVSQIALVLGMNTIRSDRLIRIKQRANDFKASEDFSDICQRISDYGYSGEVLLPSLQLGFNEAGRVSLCELTSLKPEFQTNEAEKPSIFKKLFAKDSDSKPHSSAIAVSDPFGKQRNMFFSAALAKISELLDRFTRDLFDEFCPLARELAFYEAAVSYVKSMRAKNVPLCTPVPAESTDISSLYDLLLAVQYPNAEGVVPNDVSLSGCPGVVITGENNSGKTVYLRSIGCAQLLFQAGLPIPAKSAKIQPRAAVYTRYAAAEKEFCSGNDAGRFEQEVREIAPLVDSVRDGSLLLLNEIFQTTSYSEGAEGLYHILRYLESRGASFILVTHLRELLGKFDGGKAVIHMQTQGGYRVAVCD